MEVGEESRVQGLGECHEFRVSLLVVSREYRNILSM